MRTRSPGQLSSLPGLARATSLLPMGLQTKTPSTVQKRVILLNLDSGLKTRENRGTMAPGMGGGEAAQG